VFAPEGITGIWDRSRLDQVITNLLSNAVKFSNGKPIEIRADLDTSWARLTVEDHGIGISPEDQAKIFERFERAVSRRSYGGLGLGLWITRQIVDAHHGRIDVTSRPGQGSTFRIELPLKPPGGALS
jgi:signal transduction histidine kinase